MNDIRSYRGSTMVRATETRSRPTAIVAVLMAATLVLSVSAFAQRGQIPSGDEFRNPYAWPSLDTLVQRSDTIVAGEVLDMRSSWSTDRREIFTTVTLRPDRRFKGGTRSLVRFRIPGGTVGDTRLTVTHSPVFAVGEYALVFLTGESGRLPRVVAGEAGKRHVRTGPDGAQTILPGFAVSDGEAGAIAELGTLDDLAAAMPDLLVAAQPRQ